METKFNFNSAICTNREQSERILALGLKKETADCCYYYYDGEYLIAFAEDAKYLSDIPAWSLHRLIEMMPQTVGDKYEYFALYHTSIRYGGIMHEFERYCSLYDNLIDCIEWLIKEGYFNKEYLV